MGRKKWNNCNSIINEMYLEIWTITSAGEGVWKVEPSCIAGKNGKWCRYFGIQWGNFSKCLL